MFEQIANISPVVTQIISYLSIKELVNLSEINRFQRNFLEGYRSAWRSLHQILKSNHIDILNTQIPMEFLDDRAIQRAAKLLSTLDLHNTQLNAPFKFSVLQNMLSKEIKTEIAKIYRGLTPGFVRVESRTPFLLYFSAQLFFSDENGFCKNEEQVLIAIYLMCLCLNNKAKNAATIFFAKLLIQFSDHMIEKYNDFIQKENNLSLFATCRKIIDTSCHEFFEANISAFKLLNEAAKKTLLDSFFDFVLDQCQMKCTKNSPIFFLPAKWTAIFHCFAILQKILQFADIKLLPHIVNAPLKTWFRLNIEDIDEKFVNSFDESELRVLKLLENGNYRCRKEDDEEIDFEHEDIKILFNVLMSRSFIEEIFLLQRFSIDFIQKHLQFLIFVSSKVHFYQLKGFVGLGFLLKCHEQIIPAKNATLLEVLDDYFTRYPRQSLSFYQLLCGVFASCYLSGDLDDELVNNLIETKFLETLFFASSKQATKGFSVEHLKNLFEKKYNGESYLFYFANLNINQQLELLTGRYHSQELDINALNKAIENKIQSKKEVTIYASFFNHHNKTGALAHDAECCTFATHKALRIQ